MLNSNNFIIEPFRHGYAVNMIKETIANHLSLPGDFSRFNGLSSGFEKDLKLERELEKQR